MPLATRNHESPGMRLMNYALGPRLGPLSAFIAKRRMPGEDWKSWADIAADLCRLTGETVTPLGVQKWARAYGIPEHTGPKSSPERTRTYVAAVKPYLRW